MLMKSKWKTLLRLIIRPTNLSLVFDLYAECRGNYPRKYLLKKPIKFEEHYKKGSLGSEVIEIDDLVAYNKVEGNLALYITQIHDILHAVTKYGHSPFEEAKLQAFCIPHLYSKAPVYLAWLYAITRPWSALFILKAYRKGKSLPIKLLDINWQEELHNPAEEVRTKYGF